MPVTALDDLNAENARSPLTPIEMVGLSELFYRKVFTAGLWICLIVSSLSIGLATTHENVSLLAIGALILISLAQSVLALRSYHAYSALRARPGLIFAIAVVLAAASAAAGPENQEFAYVSLVTLSAWGIAVRLHVLALACIVAAAGLAAPAIDSPTTAGLAAIAMACPIFFWLLVDFLARFMLDLGFSLRTDLGPRPEAAVNIGSFSDLPADAQPPRAITERAESTTSWSLAKPRWRRVFDGPGSPLTARQEQVVFFLCAGYEDQEIATMLGISVALVRRHLSAARERTNSATRPQLAAWAVERGLV